MGRGVKWGNRQFLQGMRLESHTKNPLTLITFFQLSLFAWIVQLLFIQLLVQLLFILKKGEKKKEKEKERKKTNPKPVTGASGSFTACA